MVKRIMTFVAAVALNATAMAQYPQLTSEAKHAIDSAKVTWAAHVDSMWAEALPIVLKEAAEGRPYVPWASRPTDLVQASIPAFPGAEGGGMYTPGGRGGKVLVVTNLNDSGEGSFRWACEQGGARIVVFNVSGIINLKTPIYVRAPYITIAGQTAPGEGICIAGESFQVDTHDVIVRHMRFRRGKTNVMDREDSFGGNPVGNIMIDHCSCEWGLDENISFYRHMFSNTGKVTNKLPTVNVTIQNTISAKALDTWNHAFGSTIGGENTAFLRNLWADNSGRNPSVGWAGTFNFINNIIYNYVHRTADGGQYESQYNFINNYYKPGPLTPDTDIRYRILRPESRFKINGIPIYGRVYANGNIVEGNDSITADNWRGGIQPADDKLTPEIMSRMKMDKPFATPYLNIMPTKEAYNFVLDNVGATFPCRDIIDQRIVEEVRTGKAYYVENLPETAFGDTAGLSPKSRDAEGHFKYRRLPKDSYKQGIITDPAQMGGYPQYKKYKAWKDTDGDGMPDEWEKKNGLNPKDASDATADCNGDGYTNIEKFINGIPTDKKVDWTDLKNNYDTLKNRKSLL